MKMFPLCLIIALTFGTATHAFRAQNDMQVSSVGVEGFRVAYTGGRSGVSDFWCAAGDYVVRELGRSGNTRIYRTTSVPRRSGEALEFSLSSEGAKRTGLVTLFGGNRYVTAARARAFCNLPRVRNR